MMSGDRKNLNKRFEDNFGSSTSFNNCSNNTLRRTKNCEDLQNLWRTNKNADASVIWDIRTPHEQEVLKREKSNINSFSTPQKCMKKD